MNLVTHTESGLLRQRRYTGRGPITLTEDGRRKRHEAQLAYIEQRIAKTKAPDGFTLIPGYGGAYSISDDGRVFGHYKGGAIATRVGEHGYTTVTLKRHGHGRPWEVHVLVARTFIGPCPAGHEVDHRNRIKTDNRSSNLRYVVRPTNGHNAEKPKLVGTTKFRGVVLMRGARSRPWRASVAGPSPQTQYHATAVDAATAYDVMAVNSFGPTAVTNKSLGLL